jgi:hypothetical protein
MPLASQCMMCCVVERALYFDLCAQTGYPSSSDPIRPTLFFAAGFHMECAMRPHLARRCRPDGMLSAHGCHALFSVELAVIVGVVAFWLYCDEYIHHYDRNRLNE